MGQQHKVNLMFKLIFKINGGYLLGQYIGRILKWEINIDLK